MSFKMKYKVETRYIPSGTKRRAGIKIPGGRPTFGVLHDTGNKNSTASGNVNYYIDSRNTMEASAHTFIDDKIILECIPMTTGTPEKAWHVLYNLTKDNQMFGDNANDRAVGIELCYGTNINHAEAYKRYIWYAAYCAYKFGFSPTRFVGHHILDPGRKTDPVNALRQHGKTYDQLLADVINEYNDCVGKGAAVPSPAPAPSGSTKVHTVVKGETLWGISQKYGVTVDRIISANTGVNPNLITVGQKINIPGTAAAPAPKPPAPKPPATSGVVGKRVEAKVDVRFYTKASWADKDVAGICKKGQGFTILGTVSIGGAQQYRVKNSKGAVYYITASSKYVAVK